jgi:NAD(P)-dependent dehydrogenase (short-subunit alcohol dehydrogenase family)
MFDVNVKAAFKMVRLLVPFLNKGSHIINISSMGGFQGSVKFAGLSLYSAAKGALNILTESLALELTENKISVNALALGAVQTEMLSAAFPDYEAPLKPDEMASFIKDFALNGHKVYNGKILPVSLSTP